MLRLARRTGPVLLPHVGRSVHPYPLVGNRRGAWQGAGHADDAKIPRGEGAWSNAECLTVASLALAAVAGTTVAYKATSKALAGSIKTLVETYDTSFIGVDITIGTLYIYPLHAKAQVLDLTINNPPGYETPYMMKAGKLTLDLDWWSIINPYSKNIIVEKATFKHATVNIEYHHLWDGKSNLDDIAERAHHPDKDPHPEWKAKKEKAKKTNASDRGWLFEELKLVDVVVHYNRGMLKEQIMLPNIVYDHFSREVGSNYADDIIIILLQFIVKNVVAHIASPAMAARLCKPAAQEDDEFQATLARHPSWKPEGK